MLRITTKPTSKVVTARVIGSTKVNSCIKFTTWVGEEPIEVHAVVIPHFEGDLLIRINTLENYEIDIPVSRSVIKIKGLEVPLLGRSSLGNQSD